VSTHASGESSHTTLTKEAHCPFCGHSVDALTDASGAAFSRGARPDDITICAYCAGVLIVSGDLTPRRLTAEEARQIAQNVALRSEIEEVCFRLQLFQELQAARN
jgi:hypothetical protein